MKVMAVVGRVAEVKSIVGADLINQVAVICGSSGKWSGVAGKTIKKDDLVTVFFQDALLPQNDRWSFMENHKWRVRMCKFKGVPSECLIIEGAPNLPIGTDLSEALGITKFEKPIPINMNGVAVGAFPDFIPKTDEMNFQSVPDVVAKMKDGEWYVTEKADGTSCTVWKDEDNLLRVCSRNWELKDGPNSYWEVARKYGLGRLDTGVALQFEIVGPGIQGNPMGLKELEARAFSLYDFKDHKYKTARELIDLCNGLRMPQARLIETSSGLRDDDILRKMAEIKYDNGQHAEGIVVRAVDSSWSFKVINLNYKG